MFRNIPLLSDPQNGNRLWMDYGITDNRSPTGARNPQPAFILPAGTSILAMIDGIVVQVNKLYGNDYAISIAGDE